MRVELNGEPLELPKGASVARVHTRLVIFGAESVARVQEFCLKAAELRGVAS